MNLLQLFLTVFSYICLCLCGISFLGSLILALISRSGKGFVVPGIYAVIVFFLILFMSFCPGGSEAWMTVIFFTICIAGQFILVGRLRYQSNRILRFANVMTLFTTGFLLSAVILMNTSFFFR